MGAVHHTIATNVYKKLSYDFQKSFDPVTTVALVPNVLVVNAANTKATSPTELVALAKKSPTGLAYGSNGYGTLQHRSEEHTSELQSIMRISYAGYCLKKKTQQN